MLKTKVSKEDMIKQILQRSGNTLKITNLKKMKVADIKQIYSSGVQVVQQVEEKKQRERPQRVVRNFEDISDSEDEQEVKINVVQPISQVTPPQVVEQPIINTQPVVQQQQQVVNQPQQVVQQPSVEHKIKKNTELKLDHIKEPPKQLTVQAIRKEIRNRFATYQKDLKLLSKDFQRSLISKEELTEDFQATRDDFVDDLESWLDTQKKLSDVQYDYINDLLDKSVQIIEDSLSRY